MNATTTTEPPSATARYAGWFRANRRERWQRIVEAASHDEAWGRLLAALEEQGRRGGDSTVTSAAEDPNKGASARPR